MKIRIHALSNKKYQGTLCEIVLLNVCEFLMKKIIMVTMVFLICLTVVCVIICIIFIVINVIVVFVYMMYNGCQGTTDIYIYKAL